jgi:hypothetical protein
MRVRVWLEGPVQGLGCFRAEMPFVVRVFVSGMENGKGDVLCCRYDRIQTRHIQSKLSTHSHYKCLEILPRLARIICNSYFLYTEPKKSIVRYLSLKMRRDVICTCTENSVIGHLGIG